MNLEGSLDAFGLPDVVTLLASTGKTGGLALRNDGDDGADVRGVLWFRDGRITGAAADRGRASLVRRLIGSGAIDDAALRHALARAQSGGIGVAKALVEAGAVDVDLVREAARDQIVDATFDLLRWTEGEFGFDPVAADLDDVGVSLDPATVLDEARSRIESWTALEALVPGSDAVLALPVVLDVDPVVTVDEWALLALVDGRRTVRDLVELTGCGRFQVTTTLAHLVQRGLLHVTDTASPDHVSIVERRLGLLATVEEPVPLTRQPEPEAAVAGQLGMSAAAALAAARAAQGQAQAGVPGAGSLASRPAREVVPPRPEPFLPGRRPEHPEPALAEHGMRPTRSTASSAPSSASTMPVGGGAGVVEGATARSLADPMPVSAAEAAIERDPSVNRSLLLRLIAGVRGL